MFCARIKLPVEYAFMVADESGKEQNGQLDKRKNADNIFEEEKNGEEIETKKTKIS